MEKGRCMDLNRENSFDTGCEDGSLAVLDWQEAKQELRLRNDVWDARMKERWNRLLAQVKDDDLRSESRPRARRKKAR